MDYQGMTGKIYQVEEKRMNGGGEGTIHGIVGMNGYVAKIFKPDKRSADREEKLRCMVKKGATVKNLEHITWPLDVIYNAEGFAGYVMQKIENVQSLTAVYNGDKYNLRFRLLAAYNLCAAVETVHNMGQVCGDLNPQNICINLNVNDKANAFKVTLVDADSYHFSTEEKTYRCEVGLADYLAPEIQKKVSGGVTLRNAPLPTFTKETDLFALAVHVFCLLMNGCHPFACAKRMNGTVENTMSQMTSSSERESVVAPQPIENIKDGYFPFYDSRENVTIPIYAPPLSSLPQELRTLFIRTFKDGYEDPTKRATAEEWCRAMQPLVQQLQECPKKHVYFKQAAECPFCRVDENIRLMFDQRNKGKSKENLVKSTGNGNAGNVGSSGGTGTTSGGGTNVPPKKKKKKAGCVKTAVITLLVIIVAWFLLFVLTTLTSNVARRNNTDNVYSVSQEGEQDFTNCGMKMQVPEGARIYDSMGSVSIDTNQLRCGGIYLTIHEDPEECEQLNTTGNFYEEPLDEMISDYKPIEDDQTTITDTSKILLGKYYFARIVSTRKSDIGNFYECNYYALHEGYRYHFKLSSMEQEISQEDMELAEQMIASAQYYFVSVQLKLVDEKGEKLELDGMDWMLYINKGDTVENNDNHLFIYDSEVDDEQVVLPPGHYTAKLVKEDDDLNEVASYVSSFDVPDGGGEVNVAFSL
ncbi:MAG: hypothetical protein PUG66_03480 [Clostridiales bacterium]|nr:hypothetical protein [Clostridiales bacterium]